MTDLPLGTALVCPECGRTLYKLTVPKRALDKVQPNEITRIDGQYDPETMFRMGQPVTCPVDGVVPAHKLALRRPDGSFAFGAAPSR